MVAVFLLGMACTCVGEHEPSRFEFRQTHMGSEFKIVLYTTREVEARRASNLAFARIAALDRALSDYDPESELSQLGDRSGGPAVAASDDLFRCLEMAQVMADATGGAFDPTIGPVGRQWRRARRNFTLPNPEAIDRARALVGYRMIELDPTSKTVRLGKQGMKLDLGGIAKGFACDEAMAALKASGIRSALVAGAGDIVVSKPPPGERGWTVEIANPGANPANSSRTLIVRDAAGSTSGDAERFVEIGGRRYSHIVDPATGVGVERRASVTVVARDGATADSLATAAFVLGPERGLVLIDRLGATGLFLLAGSDPGTAASRGWVEAPKVVTAAGQNPDAVR